MPDAFTASDMQKYESLTFPQTNSLKKTRPSDFHRQHTDFLRRTAAKNRSLDFYASGIRIERKQVAIQP